MATDVRRVCIALSVLVLAACGSRDSSADASAAPTVDITGAGATFPFPVYRQWISDYSARAGVRINYMSVGSSEGLRLLSEGRVDFGASEREPTDAELGPSGCMRVAVPMLVGAVAVAYHIPGLDSPLRLDRETLRQIFDGRVSRWNAPAIVALNPGSRLPATPISVVYRTAGSATSVLFSEFLRGKGRDAGAEPSWRVGIAAEGNEGVAAQIQQTVGSIGYVELAYATPNGLEVALIRNGAGEFARPSEATLNATVSAGLSGRADARGVSLVSLSQAGTYPIGGITWLVLDPGKLGEEKGRKIVAFARWALREGADAARRLEYVPLPAAVVAHYDSVLTSLSFGPCTAGGTGEGR
jgi:phosphate transport system substrate-binding protein